MNPKPTLLEDRAARSHREATAVIETERALREAKTARLRALRLAEERKEELAPPAKAARRKKAEARPVGNRSAASGKQEQRRRDV
jgi:hypothetical protein